MTKVWKPVKDGYKTKWKGVTLEFRFYDSGYGNMDAPVVVTESRDALNVVLLPDNIRLCELVDAPPTVPPSPGQAGMPEDVRDYLTRLALAEENKLKYLTSRGFDESSLAFEICRKALAHLDSAGAEG